MGKSGMSRGAHQELQWASSRPMVALGMDGFVHSCAVVHLIIFGGGDWRGRNTSSGWLTLYFFADLGWVSVRKSDCLSFLFLGKFHDLHAQAPYTESVSVPEVMLGHCVFWESLTLRSLLCLLFVCSVHHTYFRIPPSLLCVPFFLLCKLCSQWWAAETSNCRRRTYSKDGSKSLLLGCTCCALLVNAE